MIVAVDSMNVQQRSFTAMGFVDKTPGGYIEVFNFARSLTSWVDAASKVSGNEPVTVVMAMEGGACLRSQVYAGYKAKRSEKKRNLRSLAECDSHEGSVAKAEVAHQQVCLAAADQIIDALPVVKLQQEGMEADDVIALLAWTFRDERVVVVSTDGDYLQLTSQLPNVEIWSPKEKALKQRAVEGSPQWDLHPHLYKALMGDASDEIPSVLGKKTAEKLMESTGGDIAAIEAALGSKAHRAKAGETDPPATQLEAFRRNMELVCLLPPLRASVVPWDEEWCARSMEIGKKNIEFSVPKLVEIGTLLGFESWKSGDSNWNKIQSTWNRIASYRVVEAPTMEAVIGL